MKKYIVSVICLFITFCAMGYVVMLRLSLGNYSPPAEPVPSPAESAEPTPVPTPTPTPAPTPTPTPEPEYFTLSFIGDCTLASHQYTSDYSAKMSGDYSYPFSNTVQYFENDEYTIGNLECSFSDKNLWSEQTFFFRAPAEWANILVQGGVDFVTTANNHSMDFGTVGTEDTYAALEAVNIPYGTENQAQIVTTPNGLKLGIYCAFNGYMPDTEKCVAAIGQLKDEGADYIICAFHWGVELHVRPEQYQIDLAHACIDAGADMIFGSHPHCLQPIEEYNGGIILYSMGNWSFGGNTNPSDWDTAIVQVTLKRDPDGSVTSDGITVIPCCVSEARDSNDYRPTPYEEGTEEYDRVISKLDGSFDGPNGNADYSAWHNEHS